MHMAARGILHRMEKKIEEKELFGSVFTYDEIYFSMINDVPVTVEPFLSGNFVKYVNNNGVPGHQLVQTKMHIKKQKQYAIFHLLTVKESYSFLTCKEWDISCVIQKLQHLLLLLLIQPMMLKSYSVLETCRTMHLKIFHCIMYAMCIANFSV